MTTAQALIATNLYPAGVSDALINAVQWPNRRSRIDEITDQLVRSGHCRPRHDMSRDRDWAAMRPLPALDASPQEAT